MGATCYQPSTAERPRPCPAREKGQRGCDCVTQACAQICKRATPRDPQARFVWYTGGNQDDGEEGQAHYGYRSLPLQLADRERRFSLTLLSDVRPANQREEVPAAALLLQLGDHYPDLGVDAVAGDAGLGFEVFLRTVYEHLGARRVVDLRGHESDRDEQGWVLRGYDDQGRPVCEYGYALRANGLDGDRRRQAKQQPHKAEALRKEAGYFHNNRKRMNYLEMRAEGYPIGSGMVESAAKQYKARFCGSGMRWSRKGAERLLPIRTTIMSGRFDKMWHLAYNSPPN